METPIVTMKLTTQDFINRVLGTPEQRKDYNTPDYVDPVQIPDDKALIDHNFTWDHAIMLQREGLAYWKEVLSDEAYKALETLTKETTEVVTGSPYSVPRGDWLLNVVIRMMQ